MLESPGWTNPPAQRGDREAGLTHLAYYADHFSCVEINSSFYRPHQAATYARLAGFNPRTIPFLGEITAQHHPREPLAADRVRSLAFLRRHCMLATEACGRSGAAAAKSGIQSSRGPVFLSASYGPPPWRGDVRAATCQLVLQAGRRCAATHGGDACRGGSRRWGRIRCPRRRAAICLLPLAWCSANVLFAVFGNATGGVRRKSNNG